MINIKIGILTFHNANNYGAVLQAYALQEYLKRYFTDVSIVDYRCEAIEKRYSFPDLKEGTLKNKAKRIVEYGIQRIKYSRFDKFRKRYFRLTAPEVLINGSLDVVIAGSDQVWNYELTDFDRTYFLKDVCTSVKKCAYAPSFGLTGMKAEIETEIREYLRLFDCLSAREETGKNLVDALTGRDVPIVADPTLLMSKSDWISKFDINVENKEYILVYTFGLCQQTIEFTNWLSEESGLRIICIESSVKKQLKGKYVRCASPDEWVALFANAKYVITNSFHGLMFSVIFEKEFYIAPPQDGGKTGSRINHMLDYLDLQNRKIKTPCAVYEEIDYKRVQARLQVLRETSESYLAGIAGEE